MSQFSAANETRLARLKAKRDIAAGTLTVPDAMALECCQKATVYELLAAQRRWGHTRASGFLQSVLGASAQRLVRELTNRQRGLVADELAGAAT